MGLVRLSSSRFCNHVTDQFSRFEQTQDRKPVEMNSGMSGYELISICWHLLVPDSFTSCRLSSLEPMYDRVIKDHACRFIGNTNAIVCDFGYCDSRTLVNGNIHRTFCMDLIWL